MWVPKDPQGHLDEEAWECTASPKRRYVNDVLWRFLSSCQVALKAMELKKELEKEASTVCWVRFDLALLL